jgi:hypothetical protein
MTARLETIIRQKQLERAAVDLVTARYPDTHARAIDSMIVLRMADQVLCLDLKASGRPLTRHRLSVHAKMRRLGFRVVTCRSSLEVKMAIPRQRVAA